MNTSPLRRGNCKTHSTIRETPHHFFTPTCLWRRNRQRSETSAYKIRTPGNYPAESIQHKSSGLRVNPCANIFVIVGYLETPTSHIDGVRVCNCNRKIFITVVIRFSCQEMWGRAQWSCVQKLCEYEAAEWLHPSDREVDWVDRETNWRCKYW